MAAVVMQGFASLDFLSLQWCNLGLRSWGSGTSDPLAGLIHVGGVLDAATASLGLSTYVIVVVGWATGKQPTVAIGIDGGGKRCVAANFFGIVDLSAVGLVLA